MFFDALDLIFSKATGINNTFNPLQEPMPWLEEKSGKIPAMK